MATRKTQIALTDRSVLIELLRPVADAAPDRCNLTQLAGAGLGAIEARMADCDDPDLAGWYARTARGALADRVAAELDLLMKAKRLDVRLPFMRQPIPINPRQGVRLPGMKEYQQISFLALTWDEYEAWRADWLARFERAGGVRAIITLIDRVRLLHPDVANIGAALRLGGATVAAVADADVVA